MRRMLMLLVLVSLTMAGTAQAVIDWAGQAYPNNGHNVVPTGDQFVVAQVNKPGVTDSPGQGADITARLVYSVDGGDLVTIPMTYNVDAGEFNDEYIGYIPQADIVGASGIDLTILFTDESDQTELEIDGDQEGNPPPLHYNVIDALPVDVAVTFTLCMSGESTTGAPCVIGSDDAIGNWGTGVSMTQIDLELWEVTVTFPAGSNPAFEYKYKRHDCTDWEGASNRPVTLPSDGTSAVILDPDSWNNLPMGCGLGGLLPYDVTVCFQVCMDTIDYTGDVCVSGGPAELGAWGDGVVMSEIGTMFYEVCVVFAAGNAEPGDVEYKFRHGEFCDNWESVGNRIVTVDASSPELITLTHNWDDNPDGVCETVAIEPRTWSTVKSIFE